jgi:hypothetical protein
MHGRVGQEQLCLGKIEREMQMDGASTMWFEDDSRAGHGKAKLDEEIEVGASSALCEYAWRCRYLASPIRVSAVLEVVNHLNTVVPCDRCDPARKWSPTNAGGGALRWCPLTTDRSHDLRPNMPLSRVIRQRDTSLPGDGPPPTEVLDAMRSYAEGHQVQGMLHILLTRLLETQPLDPFEFLIETLHKDDQLDALEKKAALGRFDLRREKTKKQLALQLYKRLVALQRTQHKDKLEAQGLHLARGFLTSHLRLDETRSHMQKLFPSHYRDLMAWFSTHEEELSASISADQFTKACMQVLSTQASA